MEYASTENLSYEFTRVENAGRLKMQGNAAIQESLVTVFAIYAVTILHFLVLAQTSFIV